MNDKEKKSCENCGNATPLYSFPGHGLTVIECLERIEEREENCRAWVEVEDE